MSVAGKLEVDVTLHVYLLSSETSIQTSWIKISFFPSPLLLLGNKTNSDLTW